MTKRANGRRIEAYNIASKVDTSPLPWRVEMVALRALKAPQRQVRTHPKVQIEAIAKSMRQFGVMTPIIADERSIIRAGIARWHAAHSIGLRMIPVIRVSHLSETQLRAFQLADNKLAERAGWNREALAIELEELQVALPEVGLDLSDTGFEPDEIDALFLDFKEVDAADDGEGVAPGQGPPVCRRDDTWILGKHRLRIDDARGARAFELLLAGAVAEIAFLDPPYNVAIHGHVGGRGRIRHREFVCASGEMSPGQFTEFLTTTLGHCARYSADGAIHFVCMDWRHAADLLSAGSTVYDELKNVCIWVKTNAGQGSFYRNQYEQVFVFKCGKGPHINTFGLGGNGRSRSNVWPYPGVNTFKAGRMDELRLHPTVKPVQLVVDALRDCSRRGSIVLDAFCGSGTTILAAERVGRRAHCLEIDPLYGDVAIRRWQRVARRDAVLESTGQTFGEVESERTPPNTGERSGSKPQPQPSGVR